MSQHYHLPTSGHVHRVLYDDCEHTLSVTFHTNGKTYTHYAVPPDIFDGMKAHPSAGQFYHQFVKNQYPLGKIE